MRKTLLSLMALAAMTASAQYKSEVWSPDNGDGTYNNPVINADYSDPDVCVGPSGRRSSVRPDCPFCTHATW